MYSGKFNEISMSIDHDPAPNVTELVGGARAARALGDLEDLTSLAETHDTDV